MEKIYINVLDLIYLIIFWWKWRNIKSEGMDSSDKFDK